MQYNFKHSGIDFIIDINNKHVEGGMKNKGEWFYEQPMLDWIKKEYGEGGVYLDVGAWIGTHTLYFSKILKAKKVYSFEPVERHITNFKRNMAFNAVKMPKEVQLYEFGLSDKEEELFYTYDDAQINPCAIHLAKEGAHRCRTKRMDDLILPKMKIIKVDVENMEKRVLLGGENTIKKYKPHLFLELAKEPYLSDVTKLLDSWGYERKERFNATPTYRFIPKKH